MSDAKRPVIDLELGPAELTAGVVYGRRIELGDMELTPGMQVQVRDGGGKLWPATVDRHVPLSGWRLVLDDIAEDPVGDRPGNRRHDPAFRQGDVVRYGIHGGGSRVDLVGRLNARGGTCSCCSLDRPVELLGNAIDDPSLLQLLAESNDPDRQHLAAGGCDG